MASMEVSLTDLVSLEIHLGTLHTITRMSSGFSNDNYLLTASRGKYRIRVPQYSSHSDHLAAEQAVLKWASEKNTRVVPLLHLVPLPNGIYASVFPFIDADPTFDLHQEQLVYSAGRALAEFHRAVAGYSGKHPWKTLPESFHAEKADMNELRNTINEQSVSEYADFWDAVENLLFRMNKIGKQMNEQPYLSLPHLSCHGDYAPANLLTLQAQVEGMIDLECCRWAPRVHDVSTFLQAMQEDEGYKESMSDWFLNGYRSLIELSEIEREWIPAFRMIRSLEAAKRHLNRVIHGEQQVHPGLVMYWDRITSKL
ncbi:phosphotransferase enzyme family protein [Paenibacillus spongiae]|uniref:Aminoglycoside phosphotransferase family protein n=1 Tax=Paenibacillus spongiae TaxID=2909671 RepID=A0ABY5S5X4_9BACL|nr:aminoglycoside phosphotransferase family protein [Paenibacillus spongiae]UVI29069.1 aminoglycoside phosphotransferase family protein [Paenibacillus spongiae]